MFWLAMIPFLYLPWPWGEIWNHENTTSSHLALTATFLHGLHPITFNQVVPGGWSIAVESMFYMVFPILMAVANSLRKATAVLVITLATSWAAAHLALVIFAGSGVPLPALDYYSTHWLPAQLPVFMFGIVTYHLVTNRNLVRHESWLATAILLAGLTLIFGLLPVLDMPLTMICWFYAGAFSVLVFGLARGAGKWLVNPAICLLGKISFSAYLWHFAVLSLAAPTIGAFSGTLPYIVCVIAVLAITSIASTITYLLIEKPMIRLGSRVASKFASGRADAFSIDMQNSPIPAAGVMRESS